MKPIPEPVYPCKYCADEYSWPATDLFWSNQDQDWICDDCWDDRDFMTASSGEEKGVCLADEIKKSEAKHDAEMVEKYITQLEKELNELKEEHQLMKSFLEQLVQWNSHGYVRAKEILDILNQKPQECR